MRQAGTEIENQWATAFLRLESEELRMLNGTCYDQEFKAKHPKLVEFLFMALQYRANQLETGVEDACSMQDPHFLQWSAEEIANAIDGVDRLRVLSEQFPKISDFIHIFDRVLVSHSLARWLVCEEILSEQ
jgi:hypothetical protein